MEHPDQRAISELGFYNMISLVLVFDINSYNWAIVVMQTSFFQISYVLMKHVY